VVQKGTLPRGWAYEEIILSVKQVQTIESIVDKIGDSSKIVIYHGCNSLALKVPLGNNNGAIWGCPRQLMGTYKQGV